MSSARPTPTYKIFNSQIHKMFDYFKRVTFQGTLRFNWNIDRYHAVDEYQFDCVAVGI